MKRIQISLAKVRNLRKAGTLLILVTLLLLAGTALAANGEIPRYVIGGGGGHVETAPYALDGTAGQPLVGVVSNAPYQLCSGFWGCGGAGEYKIYLPVILRNYP